MGKYVFVSRRRQVTPDCKSQASQITLSPVSTLSPPMAQQAPRLARPPPPLGALVHTDDVILLALGPLALLYACPSPIPTIAHAMPAARNDYTL